MKRVCLILCVLSLASVAAAGPILRAVRERIQERHAACHETTTTCTTCTKTTASVTTTAPCCPGGICSPATLAGPCGCAATSADADDTADIAEAVARGFGSRVAIGPYRSVTLAMRQYLADKQAKSPGALARFQNVALKPNPARACKIATIAVMMLPIVNSFYPIPDYAVILAELELLQKQACGNVTTK